MRLRGFSRKALAGAALATVLIAGYAGASLAAPAAQFAGPLDETTPEPTPTTVPDPAPDPAPPAPKPAPKPQPKPVSKPAPAPRRHVTPSRPVTPTPEPRYTPPAQHATKPVAPKHTKPARKKRKKPVVQAPKPAPVAVTTTTTPTIPRVDVGSQTASFAPKGGDGAARRMLVIIGLGLSALFFLIVVTVPATPARFTLPGRVVMDHQTDVVLAGIATL
jgi:hypothetical protein